MVADIVLSVVTIIVASIALWMNLDKMAEWQKNLRR